MPFTINRRRYITVIHVHLSGRLPRSSTIDGTVPNTVNTSHSCDASRRSRVVSARYKEAIMILQVVWKMSKPRVRLRDQRYLLFGALCNPSKGDGWDLCTLYHIAPLNISTGQSLHLINERNTAITTTTSEHMFSKDRWLREMLQLVRVSFILCDMVTSFNAGDWSTPDTFAEGSDTERPNCFVSITNKW